MTDVDRRRAAVGRARSTRAPEPRSAPGGGAVPTRPDAGGRAWAARPPVELALWCGLLYLPFIGFGWGTDIDITNIRRSGESILSGDYRFSRPPGAFAHELLTGVLDRVGGSVAVNLASAISAVIALVLLAKIVEREFGARAGRIAVVVVATQPWFWVAATSLGDYTPAMALILAGVEARRRGGRVVAGLAFGLAVGFRSGTALLVAAWLFAELLGDDTPSATHDGGRSRRDLLVTGAVATLVGLALYVPPWLSVGRTTSFLQNQLRAGDVMVMVARWGVKNVAFFGLVTIIVLVARAPVLLAGARLARSSALVRFALVSAAVTELPYLRFPWKPVHLLPMIVCLAIVLAASPRTSNRLVAAVVASQLLLAVVSVSIAEPDVADAATDGRFAPGVTRGVVVNEIDCRLDPDHEGRWPDLDTRAADVAAVDAFACQARSWRAGAGPGPLPPP